jgi:hypothetical protein
MNDSIKIIQNKIQDNLQKALNDDAIKRYNQEMKKDYTGRAKKGLGDANWRLVASYPIELRTVLVNKHGVKALKDESFYKDFLRSDEMEAFRALPASEI